MRVRGMVAGASVLVVVGIALPAARGDGPVGPGSHDGRRVRRRGESVRRGYGYQGGQAPARVAIRRRVAIGRYPCAGLSGPGSGYPAPGYPPQGYPPQGYPPPAYQQPYAYPPPGQNPQQASANQMQCQEWATSQSGYNPNAPSTGPRGGSASQSAMAGGRSVVRGGARGAAVGAVGGAIAGNAGEGCGDRGCRGRHDGRVQAAGPEAGRSAAAEPAGAAAEPAERRIQPSPGGVSDGARLHRPLEERPMSTWRLVGRVWAPGRAGRGHARAWPGRRSWMARSRFCAP